MFYTFAFEINKAFELYSIFKKYKFEADYFTNNDLTDLRFTT